MGAVNEVCQVISPHTIQQLLSGPQPVELKIAYISSCWNFASLHERKQP